MQMQSVRSVNETRTLLVQDRSLINYHKISTKNQVVFPKHFKIERFFLSKRLSSNIIILQQNIQMAYILDPV